MVVETCTCRYFYCVPPVHDGLPGCKVGFHQRGPLLANKDEFIIHPDTHEWLKSLPNYRDKQNSPCKRAVLEEFDSGRDDLALEYKQSFVKRTLPCVDPTNVDMFMRCLYCNVKPNEENGADFIVGVRA